ncbi:MAG: hypothetical protein EP298_12390 [Gammaproteobacteria bacterium]|nr:MAG: hypothetical protein EP298_12390 [Gammaproteobacteria bacterium]UTW43094.1 hypothetical protein KFE69_02815 [bacterium SCSIO 12844]
MLKKLSLLIAAAMLIPSYSFAATQGTTGATSTGTVDISINVGEIARISNLSDFNLGNWVAGTVTDQQNVCIYTNESLGQYTVTASSLNSQGGNFSLYDGGSNYLEYRVYWEDQAGGSVGTSTASWFGAGSSGTTSGAQSNANTTSDTCGGIDNATLLVRVLNADLTAAVDGAYSDTLTLIIAPN